jgi:hypothetical protein
MSNETPTPQPTWKATPPSPGVPQQNKPACPDPASNRPPMPTLVQTIIALQKENAQLKTQLAEAQKKP